MLRQDKTHHRLVCASCGAPLTRMKPLPVAAPSQPAVTHQPQAVLSKPKRVEKKRPKKRRGVGYWLREMAEEAFELVEDIFD